MNILLKALLAVSSSALLLGCVEDGYVSSTTYYEGPAYHRPVYPAPATVSVVVKERHRHHHEARASQPPLNNGFNTTGEHVRHGRHNGYVANPAPADNGFGTTGNHVPDNGFNTTGGTGYQVPPGSAEPAPVAGDNASGFSTR